jgi:glutaconate CoA-transferase subunit A
MAEILSLREAVASLIRDGDTLALEGFTHLIPSAAGLEIVRQGKRDLSLVRMTPDLIYDQLIGMGQVKHLRFSWGGNPGVGSLHRFRDAVEKGWPRPLAVQEHGHADMANSYVAGASGLPFAVMRGYVGSDLPKHNDRIRTVTCPFTGEVLAAVPAVRPDVTVIHAQKADRRGNVLLWGVLGVQKEAVLAAKRSIVTVEEIVDDLEAWPNACVLPRWAVTAVACEPGGAYPSYAQGYYKRDSWLYQAWEDISREREPFLAWMKRHVMETEDFAGFRRVLDETRRAAA